MPSVVLPDKSIFCAAKGNYNTTNWGSILVNYKPFGDLNWQRQLVNPNNNTYAYAIPAINATCIGSNRIIVCGEVINGTNTEGFVAGLDFLGNAQWSFKFGDTVPSTWGNAYAERTSDVISNQNGSFTMPCVARPFSMYGNYDAFHTLVCFDTLGGILWSRSLPVSDNELEPSVIESDGTSLYVLFSDTIHSYLMKTDLIGVTQWTRLLPRKYNHLEKTITGDILVAAKQIDLSGINTVYLAKLTASGNIVWSKSFIDPAGQRFLNNRVSDLVSLSDNTIMLAIHGASAHIVHLDMNGAVKNVISHQGTGGNQCHSILEYEPGNLFIGGTDDYDTTTFALNLQVVFTDTSLNSMLCQFTPGSITAQILNDTAIAITMSASPCSFIKTTTNHISVVRNLQETTSCITAMEEQPGQENESLSLFPNPASNIVNLNWNTGSNYTLEVFDPAGRPVQQVKNITGSNYTLQTTNLPAGMYMMQLQNEKQILRARVVIAK